MSTDGCNTKERQRAWCDVEKSVSIRNICVCSFFFRPPPAVTIAVAGWPSSPSAKDVVPLPCHVQRHGQLLVGVQPPQQQLRLVVVVVPGLLLFLPAVVGPVVGCEEFRLKGSIEGSAIIERRKKGGGEMGGSKSATCLCEFHSLIFAHVHTHEHSHSHTHTLIVRFHGTLPHIRSRSAWHRWGTSRGSNPQSVRPP